MEEFALIIYVLIFTPLIISINVLLHELGHAVVALFFTRTTVTIVLGKSKPTRSFHIGRRLIISSKFWLVFMGVTYTQTDRNWRSHKRHILVYLGGPLVSFLLLIISGMLLFVTSNVNIWLNFLFLIWAVSALLQFSSTIIPSVYSRPPVLAGKASDGLNAWRFMRPLQIPSSEPVKVPVIGFSEFEDDV